MASFDGAGPARRKSVESVPAGGRGGGKHDKRALEEVERRARQAERAKAGFTPAEDAELLEVFGGYAARAGVRSLHGATQDRLLKAPPREGVRQTVLEVLGFRGGEMQREELVAEVVADRRATPYEARRAVDRLVRSGHLAAEVRPTLCRREVAGEAVEVGRDGAIADLLVGTAPRQETYEAPRPWVVLVLDHERRPARRRESGDRWAAQDAALEEFCRGYIDCEDDGSPQAVVPEVGAPAPDAALSALSALSAAHLAVVRAWYEGGTSRGGEARHADLFGAMHCRLLPLAPSVVGARAELVERRVAERVAALGRERERAVARVERANLQLAARRSAAEEHRAARAAYEVVLKEQRAEARARKGAAPPPGGDLEGGSPREAPNPPAPLPRLPPGRLRGWRAVARAGAPPPVDPARVRELVEREVRADDALREVLDAKPAAPCACPPRGRGSRCPGCLARDRWFEARRAFVARVRAELVAVLEGGVAAYRAARASVGRVGRGNAPRRPAEHVRRVRTWERLSCAGCGQVIPDGRHCSDCGRR